MRHDVCVCAAYPAAAGQGQGTLGPAVEAEGPQAACRRNSSFFVLSIHCSVLWRLLLVHCYPLLHCIRSPTLRCTLPPRVPCCSALNGLSLSGSLPAALIHRHPGLTSLWVSSAARGLREEGERLVKLASKGRRRWEEAGLTVFLLCSELRLG